MAGVTYAARMWLGGSYFYNVLNLKISFHLDNLWMCRWVAESVIMQVKHMFK